MATELDAPAAIDPDDPPSGVAELYVAKANNSGRRYHVDPDCERLKAGVSSRRVEIAAAWYDPCRYCVTDEFPRPPTEGDGDE